MLFSKQLATSSMIHLCRTLKHNLAAGLMLRDVFKQIARRGTPALRPVADRVWQALEEGDSLDVALRQVKGAFPPLFLALAGVGENTGNMPEIFGELERYYLIQQKFWRLFVSRSIWPVLQFVAATFVIAGLLTLLGLIAEFTNSKPIDILGLGLVGGRGAMIFLILIYGTLGGIFGGYMIASRTLRHKALVDDMLLRVPAIGPFLQGLALSRFALSLRLTADSAMPILKALKLSLRATGNAAFEACQPTVHDAILAGDSLTQALARCKVFPPDFLNIVAMAEESGKVPETMKQQAEYYEEEAERRLMILTQVANFAVWVFVAGLIILAIFKIFSFYLSTIEKFLP